MSASITDYFNKASSMNGDYPPVATVTAARSAGGSTLSCDDLSGWATDTPVHFSTFKVNTDGTVDTSSQTDYKGIVSGNTITEMTRLAGAADAGHASGDRVELNPTIGWLDDLIAGLLVAHKQNGALKDGIVGKSALATGAVTSSKIAAGVILNLAYPVGSYYETSDTAFDPNEDWGGAWELDTQGRVTVAQNSGTFSTVGDTGGEEKHKLTVSEMPSHTHVFKTGLVFAGSGSDGTAMSSSRFDPRDSRHIEATGGSSSHNNLQPYVVVRRWHRIA